MNKVMASIVAIALAIFLAGCDTTVPYSELSADEKNALAIKPVESAQLTQTEAEYRYEFAWNCIRSRSQSSTKFAKIAQGTQYAPKFKSASQEFAKLCAERPQNAQAKNEWTKRAKNFAQKTYNSVFRAFWGSTSSEKRGEVLQITVCRKEIQVWMQEVAQIGISKNPSRAKHINQLYSNAVRGRKKVCKDTSNAQRFVRTNGIFWENRVIPLIRAVEDAIGI